MHEKKSVCGRLRTGPLGNREPVLFPYDGQGFGHNGTSKNEGDRHAAILNQEFSRKTGCGKGAPTFGKPASIIGFGS